VDAVGVAHEDVRPSARAAQRSLRHREVVLDDLELRDPGFREIDLARVRDRDLAPGGLDDGFLRLARHAPKDTAVST
jgi:hypothetical protein